MTATATRQTAAPVTTAPPPQQQQQDDGQLIAAIIAAMAASYTAAQLTRALAAPLRAAGIGTVAVAAAASLMLDWPPPAMEGTGPASRWAVRTNLTRRALFLLNVARRAQRAVAAARAANLPVRPAAAAALAAERRYLAQHIDVSAARVASASSVDGIAAQHDGLVGWQAVKDRKCTPGCRRASGRNFRPEFPPVVEGHPALPGAVHGATCRCYAVPPFPDAPVMTGKPATV